MWGNSVAFAVLEEVAIVGATASNTYLPGVAAKAIDDDELSGWNSGKWIYNAPDQYLQIDLGSGQDIDQLKVLPATSTPEAGITEWNLEGSNSVNSGFVILEDLDDEEYVGTANTTSSDWGVINFDESVSYQYIRIKPKGTSWGNGWPGSWVAIFEVKVYEDVVFQGPEFSTYIYLATLAFTFAIGYRKIPELMREKN